MSLQMVADGVEHRRRRNWQDGEEKELVIGARVRFAQFFDVIKGARIKTERTRIHDHAAAETS